MDGILNKIISFGDQKAVSQYKRGKKKKNCQPRFPGKLSFKSEEETKKLTDNQKLKEFLTTWLALQEMLKRLLQSEIIKGHLTETQSCKK